MLKSLRFDQIRELLTKQLPEDIASGKKFKDGISLEQALIDTKQLDILQRCLSIINKYLSGEDITLPDLNRDILKLSAMLINISAQIGWSQISTEHAESVKKMSRSKYFIKAKHFADELNMKLTDTEADSLSREFCEEEYLHLNKSASVSKILTNFFYSLKSFVEVLNSLANRMMREM